ncbi:penicillin-insensitive murein endopeptidase [Marinobacterium rhizophilum]|uniref:penicillin-insensitive murein endopeptidase n=1 Tax=Marinobacterium rhizophilum TaxID=420402 RepID=UPI0021041F41|nr:penicillin-insensitive murein endopeptidase [Marinobacterium rhizophilum]
MTLVGGALLCGSIATSNATPWEAVNRPSSQASASIGQYTNGCLSGAQQMPVRGEGFQLVRTARNRHYGNPALIGFLTDFSSAVAQQGLGRLHIGDMSMARGGPFSSGHRSHQIGLDVDIWYSQDQRSLTRPLSEAERGTIAAKPLADAQAHRLVEQNWNANIPRILRLASEDPKVARIFVHPAIKRQLCSLAGNDNAWLRKIRPWWGHNYHFHVRLACPAGDKNCIPQQPVPQAPCGADLDWWFSDEFYAQLRGTAPPPAKPTPKPKPKPMPQQCTQVLRAP